MSWPRALVYLLIAGMLGTIYVVTAPPPPPPPAAAPEASAPEVAIDSMRLEAGGRTVRATRSDARWTVVEPATATVPSDLISALVAAVLETPAEPVTSDADRLADFGLDSPSTRLTFGRPAAPPVTLSLGSTNPAETGVYARLEGNPQVILVGLNVRYYIDLILKQSAGA
jgi:Domain of unknown function (DUF4340)